jgi:hypothetical protein
LQTNFVGGVYGSPLRWLSFLLQLCIYGAASDILTHFVMSFEADSNTSEALLTLSAAELGNLIASETEKWAELVKSAGLKANRRDARRCLNTLDPAAPGFLCWHQQATGADELHGRPPQAGPRK